MTIFDFRKLYNNNGDTMKILKVIPFLLALIVGLLLSKFIFNMYDASAKVETTFIKSKSVYFLQLGVYSTETNMKESTKNFPYYIYRHENNLYYVYVAITGNREVLSILKGYYKNLGYNLYEKEYRIENKEFLKILNEYDSLLLKLDDTNSYDTIIGNVLKKYKEVVITDKN